MRTAKVIVIMLKMGVGIITVSWALTPPANALAQDSVRTIHFCTWLQHVGDSLQKRQEDTLCIWKHPLTKSKPEGILGNWMADVVLRRVAHKASMCILSFGLGDTTYIGPGPFCRKDVYTLIQKDDELILIELNGTQVQELCDSIAACGGMPISGMRLTIRNKRAEKIQVGTRELHKNLLYPIVVNRALLRDPHLPKSVLPYRYAPPLRHSVRRLLLEELYEYRQSGRAPDLQLDKRIYYDD